MKAAIPVGSPSIPRGKMMRRALQRYSIGYLFMLPLVAFLILYQAYPILRVLWLSFTNYRYLYPDNTQFVGLRNFDRVIHDPVFWEGMRQAAEFTIIFIPGGVLFPLFLALLMDRVVNRKVVGIYRTLL